MRRENEQVSDLPGAAEPQRSRDFHGDRKADESRVVFGYERAEPAGAEVLVQPEPRSDDVGRLTVVSAVSVEDLGKSLELTRCRGSKSPNRAQRAGGRRSGMAVLTHGSRRQRYPA